MTKDSIANRLGPLILMVRCGNGLPFAVVTGTCVLLAVVLAQSAFYVQLVGVGAIVLALAVGAVRERRLVILFALVFGAQRMFYKLLGPVELDVHGGAGGPYLTSVDVLIALLYALWWREGTLVRDLRAGLRRPEIWVPLLAALTVLPSFLVAQSVTLAFGELFRMAWMLAVYLYIALRLREWADLKLVVVALLAICFVQAAVAGAQLKAESSLGLVRIGQEGELVPRASEDGDALRPSGTILHPVFLAAVMAELGILALTVGLAFTSTRLRWFAFAAAAAAVLAMGLSQTRVALVCVVPLAMLVLFWGASRSLVSRRVAVALPIGAFIVVAAVNGFILHGGIVEGLTRNFFSERVGFELEARQQLNDIALAVIAESPLVGVGLDNYEQVMPRYDRYGAIIEGFPPHNLYLLVWADSGFLGLTGMVATFLVLVLAAARLALARDVFLAAIGVGALAMYAFYLIEELTSFSLRHDVPLATFWILAGLSVAALGIAQREAAGRINAGSQLANSGD